MLSYTYNKCPFIKAKIDYIDYIKQTMYANLFCYRIESFEREWMSTCYYIKTSIDQYIYEENISFLIDSNNDVEIEDYFSHIKMKDYYCDIIHIMKFDINNQSLYRVKRTPYMNKTHFFSNAKFLSIEYKHPDMKYSIELLLSNNWFLEGNEILSPSFVLRLLEYQSKEYIFDMNYKINIIDNNICIFELLSDEYILFTKTGYIVKKIDLILEDELSFEEDTDNDSSIFSVDGNVVME